MNAVKAHSEINYADSIAHNTDDFSIGPDPEEIELINTLAYLNNAPTENVFENADIAEYTDEEALEQLKSFFEKESHGGIDESITNLLPDGMSSEEFQAAAKNRHFTEEQLQTIVEVQSRITTLRDVKYQEREMAKQILDHSAAIVVVIVVGFFQTATVVTSVRVSG